MHRYHRRGTCVCNVLPHNPYSTRRASYALTFKYVPSNFQIAFVSTNRVKIDTTVDTFEHENVPWRRNFVIPKISPARHSDVMPLLRPAPSEGGARPKNQANGAGRAVAGLVHLCRHQRYPSPVHHRQTRQIPISDSSCSADSTRNLATKGSCCSILSRSTQLF